MGAGERHAEDGVRAELALVRRPVEVDEQRVDAGLVGRVEPEQLGRDPIDHVGDRGQDALAAEAGLVAVAQLDRLVGAGRGAAGHGRAPDRAVVEDDVDLDRRVAARIEDLAGVDEVDRGHARLLRPGAGSGRLGAGLVVAALAARAWRRLAALVGGRGLAAAWRPPSRPAWLAALAAGLAAVVVAPWRRALLAAFAGRAGLCRTAWRAGFGRDGLRRGSLRRWPSSVGCAAGLASQPSPQAWRGFAAGFASQPSPRAWPLRRRLARRLLRRLRRLGPIQQHGHPRQLAPLEELERRAAAGRDVGHLVGQALLGDRRHRVAAADDDRRAMLGAVRQQPRHRVRAVRERRDLEHAERAVPEHGLHVGRAPRPSGPGSPSRGRRCATTPGSSRPGASCTRCRG